MRRLEATVHGLVQGVYFRYYTLQTAQKLEIVGWVANRRNGTVFVVAEGSAAALRQLLDFLHQGSPSAQVSRVEVQWLEPTHEFKTFQVKQLWA
ncbi:MAG: acylphosphatase [Ardenticatenaceae bacterium]|nr:acylphosphatase [Ardenticatenaceae bacterium]